MATPAPLPGQPAATPSKDLSGNLAQVEDSLVTRILKSGPPWLRWTALVLAVLAPYVKYPVDYLQQRSTQRRVAQVSPYSPTNAIADLSRTDPATRAELQQQDEDNKHIVWHHDVKNENPPLVSIYDSNEKGLLGYKVFDSDGCLLVERAKGTLSSTRLIRNLGGLAPGSGLRPLQFLPDKLDDWADQMKSPAVNSRGIRLIQVQAGCLNPHPGQFRFWYGPPADQCWVPMFRQFADGCTHYQMFNRCNNVFDIQIHWTVCVPQHFW
jgi:hypothetical protein